MKKTVIIEGMDCVSCETILHEALEAVPQIKVLSLSHKTGMLEVEYHNQEDFKKLKQILNENNYSVRENQTSKAKDKPDIAINRKKIVIIIGIIALLGVATQLDVTQYIQNYGPNMGFGVAFLVGLVACGSSCLAITGGIVVSYTESLEHKKTSQLLRTQILFHAGRLIAFIGLGALLGFLGKGLQISPVVNGIIMGLVACVLIYIGMHILGIMPNITHLGFHLPKGIHKVIKKLQHPDYAPIVGFLTFFLPCGFTQSIQLFAIQSGSASQGALILGAYALGTLPLLLGLGISTGYIKQKMFYFNKIIAIILIVFGLLTLSSAYKLINIPVIMESSFLGQTNKIEKINRNHLANALEPQNITLKTNTQYEITIDPERNGLGCKSAIRLPDGSMHSVQQGKPITFYYQSDKDTQISLTCATGSPHGTMIIQG